MTIANSLKTRVRRLEVSELESVTTAERIRRAEARWAAMTSQERSADRAANVQQARAILAAPETSEFEARWARATLRTEVRR